MSSFINNPIIAKELKSRMRGKQGFVMLTAYLALISLVIYVVFAYSVNTAGNSVWILQQTGKKIFQVVVLLELVMTGFIGPALTAGSITAERERKTFDTLRISLLSAREIVIGKLGAAVLFLLLLILAAIPLQSLAFFLGGVGLAEMLISIVMLALVFCTLGLYFSSITKHTSAATVLTYSTLALSVMILGAFFAYAFRENSYLLSTTLQFQRASLNFIWTLFSTNPFTAAFISGTMLTQEQSLFLIDLPDYSLALFSPWILYSIFSITMTVLMIWLIIFYLNRYER